MKMYILVKDVVPIGLSMASVAHASLACYLKFQYDTDYIEWLYSSFKKCICKVSEKEFNSAKKYPKHIIITESSLDNMETAIVFCPRKKENIENGFKFYKLYK